MTKLTDLKEDSKRYRERLSVELDEDSKWITDLKQRLAEDSKKFREKLNVEGWLRPIKHPDLINPNVLLQQHRAWQKTVNSGDASIPYIKNLSWLIEQKDKKATLWRRLAVGLGVLAVGLGVLSIILTLYSISLNSAQQILPADLQSNEVHIEHPIAEDQHDPHDMQFPSLELTEPPSHTISESLPFRPMQESPEVLPLVVEQSMRHSDPNCSIDRVGNVHFDRNHPCYIQLLQD